MKFTKYILPIFAFLLLITSCKDKVVEKEVVLKPIKFQVVGTSDGQEIRTFSGSVKAGDEIELSFRAGGIITVLNVKVGQQVEKGDLLARLDNVQANLAYEQSKSAVNAAQSAMNTAKSSLDRIKSLFESGSNSLSDYEAAKNSYQSALDQFESSKRNRSIQASQIEYGIIRAPKSGIIASKNVDLNENTSAGNTIAVLNAGKEINIVVGLPESIINKVKIGMLTDLNFTAIDGEKLKGKITEISPIVDSNSATYPVKMQIVNAPESIKPGMTASVTFNFGDDNAVKSDVLVIPVKSVGEDGKGNFVFLIDSKDGKTGTVKKHLVVLGKLTEAGFNIESGLSAGDKIATAGLQSLLDGQKVKLQ